MLTGVCVTSGVVQLCVGGIVAKVVGKKRLYERHERGVQDGAPNHVAVGAVGGCCPHSCLSGFLDLDGFLSSPLPEPFNFSQTVASTQLMQWSAL